MGKTNSKLDKALQEGKPPWPRQIITPNIAQYGKYAFCPFTHLTEEDSRLSQKCPRPISFFVWNTLRKCSTGMDSVPPEKSRDKHARCSPGTFFNIKAEIGHLGTLFK